MTRDPRNDPRQIIKKLRQADATLSADLWPEAFLREDDSGPDEERKPDDEEGTRAKSEADPLRSFQQFWNGFYGQANASSQAVPDHSTFDAKSWQRQWFDSASNSMDAYLRSPFFLQMMKHHIDTLIRTKKESNASEKQSVECGADDARAARFREAAATPYDVVFESHSFRLLRYRNEQPSEFVEPILICFALVNRPYILDLQTDRSVVRQLLARGFDVYLIDWGVPTDDCRSLRLFDYVCVFMKRVIDWVCDKTGSPGINLLGYCMGGTMSTMFTTLNPRQVRSLVLMATPIDFGVGDGLLNVWTKKEYFDVDGLIDAYGNCPGWFLQSCFQLMKPVQSFAEKYITLSERMNDEAFLENFLAMERWANDNIPVAGETFREYVKMLYRENRLVKGEMRLNETPIRLENIVCPLLILSASSDHLVPPQSTLAIQEHVNSTELTSLSVDAGHIGLAVSSKAHRKLWPVAAKWIADHSTTRNNGSIAN